MAIQNHTPFPHTTNVSVSYMTTPSLSHGYTVDSKTDLLTQEQYDMLVRYTLIIRFAMCTTGMLGNAINIRTFLRMGLDDSVTIAFFNLAVSDFFILLTAFINCGCMIFSLLEKDMLMSFYLPPLLVHVFFLVTGRALSDFSMYLTTFLAVQRCLCVVKPFHFKDMVTRLKTYIIVYAILIYSLAIGIAHLCQYEVRQVVKPDNSTVLILFQKSTFAFSVAFIRMANGLILNLSCQVLVLACVVIMARALITSVEFRQSGLKQTSGDDRKEVQRVTDSEKPNEKGPLSQNNSGSSKERQAIVQVALLSAIFLIANTPYTLMSLAGLIEPHFSPFRGYHVTFALFIYIRFVIENLNCTLNFFVYYRYNTKFRQLCFR